MFCGQIHTPATLPNYVLTHLMKGCFSACLQSLKPHMFVVLPCTEVFGFSLMIHIVLCLLVFHMILP
jgi:hypothetical protein